MLPVTAACASCGLDGWGQQPVIPIQKMNREIPSSLMECSVCYEIIHPDCVAKLVSVYLLLDLSSCSRMYSYFKQELQFLYMLITCCQIDIVWCFNLT